MIYVYAIVESCALPLPVTEGGDLEIVGHEGVAAVCTRQAARSLSPSADEVWRHERVVESLMRDRATLPARFGTRFREEDELRAVLRRNGQGLLAALERVRGCVELGVRGVWQRPVQESEERLSVAAGGGSGRAYMVARLAREQRLQAGRAAAEGAAEAIHRALAPLARDSCLRIFPPSTGAQQQLLAAAYLVERPSMEGFAQRATALAQPVADVKLLCTGPWPPYHFVPVLQAGEALHG